MGLSRELVDPLEVRAQARIGRVLREKWRLDRVLGVGGMAAVYAATHRNGKRAAVKMLHDELTIDANIRTRFLREGYVANKIEHPGAVSVLDDDVTEDGSVYLVMDLLDGETLGARAERAGGRLGPAEVLSIADQLLDVLAAAHAHGIVHRDLKPDNVFVTTDGVVKVLDFGIARLRELSMASTATQSGATMGTPSYMPPEQARGLWQEVDARSDLWAVGATLYSVLSGRLVHEGRTANEVLLAAMTIAAPPLASVASAVSPRVAEVVDRALAFERDDRWADARAMQNAVRDAYHSANGAPIATHPRLVVPDVRLEKAVSATSGDAARRPLDAVLTAAPVAAGRTGTPFARAGSAGRPMLIAGGVAILLVLGAVAVIRSGGRVPDRTASAGGSPALSSVANGGLPIPTGSDVPVSSVAPIGAVASSARALSPSDLPVRAGKSTSGSEKLPAAAWRPPPSSTSLAASPVATGVTRPIAATAAPVVTPVPTTNPLERRR